MAAFIDYAIVSIVLFAFECFLMINLINKNINSQALPYIIFHVLLSPIGLVQHVIDYPASLGISLVQLILLLVVQFACEVIIYTSFELSPLKRTIGKKIMGIRYEDDLTLKTALLRNSIKVPSRYLYGLPIVFMLFTSRQQCIHDLLAQTVVVVDV